ncbi:MAG: phosphoglycerate dehydrogenase [Rhodothermales bacterium]
MFTVQTLDKISVKGLELFPRDTYEMAADPPAPDAILVRSRHMHDMVLPVSVKAVARAGAGVNNIPIDACSRRGIVVFNTPGANANSVKELVIAGLLLSSRWIVQGVEWAKSLAGNGAEVPKLVEQGKKQFAGPEITGKTLGVIGLGAIGVAVANDASALGMEVVGYDPFLTVDSAWGLSRSVRRAAGLEALFARSDYITIHAPLNDTTHGLINADTCRLMKDGVRILNFARGELVDNDALFQAFEEEKIAAYVTDFPNEALIQHEKVIAVPHLGASTPEAEDNCAVMAIRQLRDFLEHGNITNSVNFPNCRLAQPPDDYRIVIANKNEPNMIGQITTVLARRGINIADMINKGRGDLAYTIIDVDTRVSDEVVEQVRTIDGVITARAL